MKTYITLDPDNYLRLSLIVPAIALLGSTRRSTADDPPVRTIPQRTQRLLRLHITPRAEVLTDHGHSARNLLNNSEVMVQC
jgi:hypothetical protein